MNCNYIIKHYWDEINKKSATLEPTWLTSGKELSPEKSPIKELYKKTLGDATYYGKLAKSKLKSEVINGYKIKYTYLEKDDPLGIKDKNGKIRRVTDISMCITTPIKLPIKSFLIGSLFIFITIFIGYFLLNKNTEVKIQMTQSLENIQVHNLKKNSVVTLKEKKDDQFKICNEQYKTYVIKGYESETNCLQSYLASYCNGETKLMSKEWLQETKNRECKNIGISVFQYNSLKSDTFRHSRKLKQQVKKFLQGKK